MFNRGESKQPNVNQSINQFAMLKNNWVPPGPERLARGQCCMAGPGCRGRPRIHPPSPPVHQAIHTHSSKQKKRRGTELPNCPQNEYSTGTVQIASTYMSLTLQKQLKSQKG